MGIYTHNCVGTNDVDRAGKFYDAALAPLGIRRLGAFLNQGLSYGSRAAEFLVLKPIDGQGASPGNGITIGFKAPDREAVAAFHAAGLAAGGSDAGTPGPRGAVPYAFGAYLFDPDGNKICAYCFTPPQG
jgi:catechol 2,3-dioxygenase-like lactoylglutathione lyase family enzyme